MRTDHVATIAGWVLGIGILVLIVGFGALLIAGDPGNPTCGGRAMSPGDVCVSHPSGSRSTYAELQAAHTGQQQAAPGIITVGVVMAVAGVATLLVRHAITSAQPGVAAQAEPDWWTDREQDR